MEGGNVQVKDRRGRKAVFVKRAWKREGEKQEGHERKRKMKRGRKRERWRKR